jgi:L-cysteine desulfidase
MSGPIKVKSQGIFDLMSILDKKTIKKIKDIVEAIDPDMIKRIMQSISVDKDGYVTVKIKLGVQIKEF